MSKGSGLLGEFPQGVNGPIQYGVGVKAHAVYLSQYQLLPYNRIEEYFSDQLGIPNQCQQYLTLMNKQRHW